MGTGSGFINLIGLTRVRVSRTSLPSSRAWPQTVVWRETEMRDHTSSSDTRDGFSFFSRPHPLVPPVATLSVPKDPGQGRPDVPDDDAFGSAYLPRSPPSLNHKFDCLARWRLRVPDRVASGKPFQRRTLMVRVDARFLLESASDSPPSGSTPLLSPVSSSPDLSLVESASLPLMSTQPSSRPCGRPPFCALLIVLCSQRARLISGPGSRGMRRRRLWRCGARQIPAQ